MPEFLSLNLPFSLVITAFLGGYFIGAVPFGLVVTQLAGLGDIREIGSGNIGATNVLRTGHKGLAVATLAGDLFKGTIAVLIGKIWGGDAGLVAGLGAFLGHLYPFWLRFKGGKGVATYIGILLGLYWPAAIGFCVIWLLIAVFMRYSSLSALVASLATPGILAIAGEWKMVALFMVLTVLIFIRHSTNIQRLLSGEESKIGRE